MVLHILRAIFILLVAAVGYFYLQLTWLSMTIAVAVGVLVVCVDILSPRRKLAIFAGTFFGLLIGVVVSYALSFAVRLIIEQANQYLSRPLLDPGQYVAFANLLIGVTCCYLSISFVLQTKDDFRFIIPYVEFSKQTKGARPILLDTSVLIDGRIGDIAGTGILESQLVVPRFVLEELQLVADHSDGLKRNRGRRGLDVLTKLRNGRADVVLYESTRTSDRNATVDQRLMDLARELNARVLSNDYNLSKVAQLREVDVININDLANALKPVVLPGERMVVRLVKAGEEAGQAVGYLSDGTMVVVEGARQHLNEDAEFVVTRALQTSAGRMIFGRLPAADSTPAGGGPRRPRPRSDSESSAPA